MNVVLSHWPSFQSPASAVPSRSPSPVSPMSLTSVMPVRDMGETGEGLLEDQRHQEELDRDNSGTFL